MSVMMLTDEEAFLLRIEEMLKNKIRGKEYEALQLNSLLQELSEFKRIKSLSYTYEGETEEEFEERVGMSKEDIKRRQFDLLQLIITFI